MTKPPRDVRELVGDDLPEEERERLQRVHELVVQAGPPPELSPTLATPPEAPKAAVASLFERRRSALALVAAALVAAAFAGGYFLGSGRGSFAVERTAPPMVGTPAAPAAFASLQIGRSDNGGNWPIRIEVRGLRSLPDRDYYVLWLSRDGRPVALCGTFRVHDGVTSVEMNAPYRLKRFDGWIVTVQRQGQRRPGPVVMVTQPRKA